MKSSNMSKIILFISSYFPLYIYILIVELVLKDGDSKTRIILASIILILISISVMGFYSVHKGNGSVFTRIPDNAEFVPESDVLMNYMMTYLIPLLSFDISRPETVIINLFLFFVLGLLYVRSSATYLNPLWGFMGYKIYQVSNMPNTHHIITKMSYDALNTMKQSEEEILEYNFGNGIKKIGK